MIEFTENELFSFHGKSIDDLRMEIGNYKLNVYRVLFTVTTEDRKLRQSRLVDILETSAKEAKNKIEELWNTDRLYYSPRSKLTKVIKNRYTVFEVPKFQFHKVVNLSLKDLDSQGNLLNID